jgi:hypothetical protein
MQETQDQHYHIRPLKGRWKAGLSPEATNNNFKLKTTTNTLLLVIHTYGEI